ncbi:MAG: bacillithiol system redox-active protein YtxJ [Planctomycetes bacterium]|nr:bacillithiol system redox-active protein YtxJ [Planctomycetota bacterium]
MTTIAVTSIEEVDALLSSAGPAWLLKHSNACSISSAAHDEFRAYCDAHPDEPAGIVVVQTHRAVSLAIATRLSMSHQSPQLFLLAGGTVAWATSHWGITAAAMTKARSALRA